jgi:hypothetical protein
MRADSRKYYGHIPFCFLYTTWLWIRTQQKAWLRNPDPPKRTVPGNLGGSEYPVVEEEGAEPLIVDHAHQSPQLAHDSLLVPWVHPQVFPSDLTFTHPVNRENKRLKPAM